MCNFCCFGKKKININSCKTEINLILFFFMQNESNYKQAASPVYITVVPMRQYVNHGMTYNSRSILKQTAWCYIYPTISWIIVFYLMLIPILFRGRKANAHQNDQSFWTTAIHFYWFISYYWDSFYYNERKANRKVVCRQINSQSGCLDSNDTIELMRFQNSTRNQ